MLARNFVMKALERVAVAKLGGIEVFKLSLYGWHYGEKVVMKASISHDWIKCVSGPWPSALHLSIIDINICSKVHGNW